MNPLFRLLFIALIFNLSAWSLNAQSPANMEAQIDGLISQLSLDEKIKLIHAQSKFTSAGVDRLGIPELHLSDGPHGVREEIDWDDWASAGWTNDSVTAFPALSCLAATFNPDLAFHYGQALAEEARYRNKDVILGPGVNIYRSPLNGRNFEYMGEDPFLASQMAVPYIRGVQSMGVAACVKHFALNNQEQWRNNVNVEVSDRALHEIYLPAFKASVEEAGVWSIMGAYNQYRGQHCCHNERLLKQILKEDWAFDGAVISDWGGTHSTLEAALNGLDLEMGTGTDGLSTNRKNAYDDYFLAKPLLEKIEQGSIEVEILNDKVQRILRLMLRTSLKENRPRGRMNNPEHLDLAEKVATEGIVLLKNEDSFLPIDPNTELTIAIIGENATRQMTLGGGSSALKAKHEISPLEGIKAQFPKANILHSVGYASGPSIWGRTEDSKLNADSLRKEALTLAGQADIVLFIGGLNKSYQQDCEGGDRLSYHLPFKQDDLISEIAAINKNTALLLVSGNAVAMPWLHKVKALLQVWYLGSQTGPAIGAILSGEVNPSGKLPFTIAKELSDNGAHSSGPLSYPGIKFEQNYLEDILVGYRWHDTKTILPQFPFGYGLSYTDFHLNTIVPATKTLQAGDSLAFQVALSNTGKTTGATVVQVYIGKAESAVPRALKELKAFKKIELKAGEKQNLLFKLPVQDWAYYDQDINNWKLEPGTYTVYVGFSSAISPSFQVDLIVPND